MKEEKEVNFEEKMQNLEKIVNELEQGNLNLDESIEKFEEGMEISKQCNQFLGGLEKKITVLLEEDGEIKEKKFENS